MTHTPTPWYAGKESHFGVYGILVHSGRPIGYALTEEDAAYIVRAVNAHDDLVAALQECRKAEMRRRDNLKKGSPASQYTEARLAMISAALAKGGA